MQFFFNNLIVSVAAVLVSLVVGVPAAYALARFQFKGKEDIAFTILSFRFAPEILVILPLYLIYQRLGLYDTYFGLIWVYQLITLPLLIWILRGFFEDISPDIEAAAQLDGYTWWQVFLRVLLPLVSRVWLRRVCSVSFSRGTRSRSHCYCLITSKPRRLSRYATLPPIPSTTGRWLQPRQYRRYPRLSWRY